MASLAQCGSRSVETRPARIAAVSRLVGVGFGLVNHATLSAGFVPIVRLDASGIFVSSEVSSGAPCGR
jgi:hypothetical protein